MLFWSAECIWCHWGSHWSLLVLPLGVQGDSPGGITGWFQVQGHIMGSPCQSPLTLHFLIYVPSPGVSGWGRKVLDSWRQRFFLDQAACCNCVSPAGFSCPLLIYLCEKEESWAWGGKRMPLLAPDEFPLPVVLGSPDIARGAPIGSGGRMNLSGLPSTARLGTGLDSLLVLVGGRQDVCLCVVALVLRSQTSSLFSYHISEFFSGCLLLYFQGYA